MNDTPSRTPPGLDDEPESSSPSIAPAPTATGPSPEDTERAYHAAEAEITALPEGEVEQPRVDLQEAAVRAQQAATDLDADAPLVERFKVIAATREFNFVYVTGLGTYARAAWYARHRQLSASGRVTRARVPESLVAEATTVRDRMFDLADYHFSDDPTESAHVTQIAAGTGHQDLANDLLALADLYARNQDAVSKDTKKYRADDAARARKLSADIVKALGARTVTEYEFWTDRAARAWTLLARAYDEVRSLGSWLLRESPALAAERFPSLIAGARARPVARPQVETKTEEKVETPPVTPPTATEPKPTTPRQASAPSRKRRRTRR